MFSSALFIFIAASFISSINDVVLSRENIVYIWQPWLFSLLLDKDSLRLVFHCRPSTCLIIERYNSISRAVLTHLTLSDNKLVA